MAFLNFICFKNIEHCFYICHLPSGPGPGGSPVTADFCLPAPYGWNTYREKSDMHAVKLSPEELVAGPDKSDWLLLCRLRPRGLPKPKDGPDERQTIG